MLNHEDYTKHSRKLGTVCASAMLLSCLGVSPAAAQFQVKERKWSVVWSGGDVSSPPVSSSTNNAHFLRARAENDYAPPGTWGGEFSVWERKSLISARAFQSWSWQGTLPMLQYIDFSASVGYVGVASATDHATSSALAKVAAPTDDDPGNVDQESCSSPNGTFPQGAGANFNYTSVPTGSPTIFETSLACYVEATANLYYGNPGAIEATSLAALSLAFTNPKQTPPPPEPI